MKKHLFIVLFSLYTTLALSLWDQTSSDAAVNNDTIIAVVNNDIITLKDLHDYLSAIYLQLSSEEKSQKQLQEIMKKYETEGVQRLIDDKLIIDAANKRELTIRDKTINDKIEEFKKGYASEQDFEKSLNNEGLTISDLQKRIGDQLKIRYLVESEVRSKIFVNPNEVTKFYQDHLVDFKKQERVELDSIFIPNSDNPVQKTKDVLGVINGGKDFLEVAREYSQMPSIGIVEKGQMLPEIEEVIFNLKDHAISKPVTTDTGVFIFKLKRLLPAETQPIDEVKDKIYQFLFNQEFQKRMHAWIEELRKKAYIEIKE